MQTLVPNLRRQLERTVIEARDVAGAGARAALEALAVHYHEPYRHMGSEQRTLRRRLRAHARQLGDRPDARSGSHGIDHLVHECAYEHWHGMLFARFLAENHLLIEHEMGVAISLDECEELAKEEGVDKWALAARFAHRMLPQVFRPDHPVFEVQFAREYRLKLEGVVESLPAEVFTAMDSLGWVYQFWQTKRKDEINRSEVKIGADELPAVTQLFTEPYMVQFLLHNSLGAWWVSRHPDKACPVDLTYLRRTEDGGAAAGAFEGWPNDLSEFRLLDPCCGSAHFLVAAFLMLVPMRMALEGLDAAEAVDAVLRENIHGLELDQRCVAIAAFALALEAWRFPDAGGFRTLPKLNLAWCGQPVAGKKEQWLALAEGDSRLEAGMTALYETFRDAPTLGSLIDPTRSVSEDMWTAGFSEVQPLLEKVLREHAGEEEWEETAIAARGLAFSASQLRSKYDLIITNVPFRQSDDLDRRLNTFTKSHFPKSKSDLATVFHQRLLSLLNTGGSLVLVMPQGFLYKDYYSQYRKSVFSSWTVSLIARLGPAAFQEITGEEVKVILSVFINIRPTNRSVVNQIDATCGEPDYKERHLRLGKMLSMKQQGSLVSKRNILPLANNSSARKLLEDFATFSNGVQTGDYPRFGRLFWEIRDTKGDWQYQLSTVNATIAYGGREHVVLWGGETLFKFVEEKVGEGNTGSWLRGLSCRGKKGVAISAMGVLKATLYTGELFDDNTVVLIPNRESELAALWRFCAHPNYNDLVREVDQSNKVRGALLRVPFDPQDDYDASKLPAVWSGDATQWIFHGHPRMADSPLLTAVARIVGYHWPAESDHNMDLGDESRTWVEKAKDLYPYEDEDGIVCIPSVRGERPASERLLQVLHAAYGDDWHDGILTKLLAESNSASLDDWLRNKFFEEHCKLFQHRPFIWHIWDGRKRDGFHALVNYHKLAEGDGKGRRLLESLTYSYLGDWIARQQDGVKRGNGGAEDRLAAALELQKRLVAILEGEPPFDLFVRWKPLEEQPMGWEPDINDGVRLNIRPFMAQDLPGGKKGAGILRAKPNIHWKKDRGKEPTRDQAQFPWFWKDGKFTGERVNDVHLTLAEKRASREEAASDRLECLGRGPNARWRRIG
ncbi:Eco57I restriction-modification methylase domain-containing protein [Nitrosococcus wardiae]|uniref:site-specific DNA-methyltransferase (adenine-specific) n=1 Tax=Nitrosococcus wardiae TaxID=1814290 RepID=A0A4P7BWA2_9GAMM|nr:N-6 DNA methylase [Nitrosococcus wardiae]QBQ53364.1 SAM-dependent DNA methyltransferase [Nitrosococcus wardiae]